jgi:hypothetical protein
MACFADTYSGFDIIVIETEDLWQGQASDPKGYLIGSSLLTFQSSADAYVGVKKIVDAYLGQPATRSSRGLSRRG